MTYALEINNLTKVYPNGLKAVNGISLKIQEGDFFALLGHNGAGKSTTINIISSIIKKTSGEVKIFGHDLETETQTCKSLLGLVPQEAAHEMGLPLMELMMQQGGLYGLSPHDTKIRAIYWLDKMGVLDKANSTIRELSGGMKRRFMIARALIHNPKLLILDEPTTGVDVGVRKEIWDFLKEINSLGVTVILTTHYLEEAEYLCRNIAIIQKGEIKVNTSMRELITSERKDQYTLDIEGYNGQELHYAGIDFKVLDEGHTLEVEIDRDINLSVLFNYLDTQGIQTISLRNSQNRLERIFLRYNDNENGE